jgi:hypothetical protein
LLAGFSFGPSLAELHEGTMAAMARHAPAVGLAVLLFAPLAVWGLWRLDARRRAEALIVAAVVIGLASFLALKNFKVYNVRYVSMLWPLVLLWVAAGIDALPWRRLRPAALGLALLIFCVALGQHYWNGRYAKEDCRGAAQAVTELAAAGEPVVIAVVGDPFRFYYRGSAKLACLWPGQDPAEIERNIEAWQRPERIWLVSARPWEWGGEAHLLAGFVGYQAHLSTQLSGVRIFELRPAI